MGEQGGPSIALLALTVAPLALLVASWMLTGGFSETPPFAPLFSRILPLASTAVAALLSIFAYNLARDEEPEWGGGLQQRLAFKAIEGAALAYIALSVVFALLLLSMYFL